MEYLSAKLYRGRVLVRLQVQGRLVPSMRPDHEVEAPQVALSLFLPLRTLSRLCWWIMVFLLQPSLHVRPKSSASSLLSRLNDVWTQSPLGVHSSRKLPSSEFASSQMSNVKKPSHVALRAHCRLTTRGQEPSSVQGAKNQPGPSRLVPQSLTPVSSTVVVNPCQSLQLTASSSVSLARHCGAR